MQRNGQTGARARTSRLVPSPATIRPLCTGDTTFDVVFFLVVYVTGLLFAVPIMILCRPRDDDRGDHEDGRDRGDHEDVYSCIACVVTTLIVATGWAMALRGDENITFAELASEFLLRFTVPGLLGITIVPSYVLREVIRA